MQGAAPAAEVRLRPAFAKLFAGGVVGKALGFGRELALAAAFGTGPAAAAFRAAQTATLIPTHYFSADALSGGFIPLLARYIREDAPRARSLFWSVTALANAIGVALAIALFFAAKFWAALVVPGFAQEHRALTAGMLRAMAVGVPFYVMASLASYVEMARGRYLIGSIRAAVQNLGLILGILAAVLSGNPLLLGWGFTAYSVLFAAVGIVTVARSELFALPDAWDWNQARSVVREFGRLVRPLLLLPLVQQGALAIERIVASLIDTQVVASLDYAKTISETGLALIAVPLGMAGLAELGRLRADAARAKLDRVLPALLLATVPCSLFLALHAAQVVRVLFARGQFDEESVAVTALVLTGLAVGFWAQVSGYVLAKALTAQGMNRRVAALVALASATQIVVNLCGFRILGALSLGLAVSASGLVLLVLAARSLRLGATLLRVLAPLALAAAAYIPIGIALRGHDGAALGVSAAACLAFWMIVVSAAPRLRAVALDVARSPALGRAQ
jgi:putative peptidoglycan lipid II flippase